MLMTYSMQVQIIHRWPCHGGLKTSLLLLGISYVKQNLLYTIVQSSNVKVFTKALYCNLLKKKVIFNNKKIISTWLTKLVQSNRKKIYSANCLIHYIFSSSPPGYLPCSENCTFFSQFRPCCELNEMTVKLSQRIQ